MTLSEFLTKAATLLGLAEKGLPAAEAKQTENQNLKTENEQLRTELTNAREKITTLENQAKEKDASNQQLTADLAAANARLADPAGEIEKRASEKAMQITAGQGQPPLKTKPSEVATSEIEAQLEAITDPIERTRFFRKNSAAIRAAAHAQRGKPSAATVE